MSDGQPAAVSGEKCSIHAEMRGKPERIGTEDGGRGAAHCCRMVLKISIIPRSNRVETLSFIAQPGNLGAAWTIKN